MVKHHGLVPLAIHLSHCLTDSGNDYPCMVMRFRVLAIFGVFLTYLSHYLTQVGMIVQAGCLSFVHLDVFLKLSCQLDIQCYECLT